MPTAGMAVGKERASLLYDMLFPYKNFAVPWPWAYPSLLLLYCLLLMFVVVTNGSSGR
jgi:hypothetical protein